MPPRIVIVGAGLSGLSLAWRLQQRLPTADIQVLEAASTPGGTARTLSRDGFTVELGPNGFLDSKPTTLNLARELGLESHLQPASDAAGHDRFLFLGEKLQRLPGSPGELLKTPLLSWRGKLSLFAEMFRRKGMSAEESIRDFAVRRAGREAADVFVDGLVTGIYAGDPAELSLPACFPRVAEMERTYGSVMKGFARAAKERRREAEARGEPYRRPRLWSLKGGLRELVDALAGSLRHPVISGVEIRAIEKFGNPAAPTWTVRADGRDSWTADVVVLTCPAHQQAGVLRDLDSALAEEIAGITFNRVAVVGLGYRAADVPGGAAGFGFITPQRLRRDVLGVQWCSSIFPGRAPDGMILMRAMCGGRQRDDVVGWDDDRLLAAVRAELKVVQNIAAEPVFHVIQRWSPGIPQYRLGHLERVSRIERRLNEHPGLYLGGNSYRGVAMNDCTEQATMLAEKIAGGISSR